nr:hypothetical protein CFP56_70197 [Quercus suber]
MTETVLKEAEKSGRFEYTEPEYHRIDNHQARSTCYDIFTDADVEERSTLPTSFIDGISPSPESQLSTQPPEVDRLGSLRCVYHRSRPPHVSGRPDRLPFKDAASLRSIFDQLDLPWSYLQLADGSLTLIQSIITYGQAQQPSRVNQGLDSEQLLAMLHALQSYAFHPMLIPCIMFAGTLRVSVARRHAIKEKMSVLEEKIRALSVRASQVVADNSALPQWWADEASSMDRLFELLHSCRHAQSSRDGRYDFWRSFHDTMVEGLEYCEAVMPSLPGSSVAKVQAELKQWTALTWHQFESLKAHDIDHVARVDDISNVVRVHGEIPLVDCSWSLMLTALQYHEPAGQPDPGDARQSLSAGFRRHEVHRLAWIRLSTRRTRRISLWSETVRSISRDHRAFHRHRSHALHIPNILDSSNGVASSPAGAQLQIQPFLLDRRVIDLPNEHWQTAWLLLGTSQSANSCIVKSHSAHPACCLIDAGCDGSSTTLPHRVISRPDDDNIFFRRFLLLKLLCAGCACDGMFDIRRCQTPIAFHVEGKN